MKTYRLAYNRIEIGYITSRPEVAEIMEFKKIIQGGSSREKANLNIVVIINVTGVNSRIKDSVRLSWDKKRYRKI